MCDGRTLPRHGRLRCPGCSPRAPLWLPRKDKCLRPAGLFRPHGIFSRRIPHPLPPGRVRDVLFDPSRRVAALVPQPLPLQLGAMPWLRVALRGTFRARVIHFLRRTLHGVVGCRAAFRDGHLPRIPGPRCRFASYHLVWKRTAFALTETAIKKGETRDDARWYQCLSRSCSLPPASPPARPPAHTHARTHAPPPTHLHICAWHPAAQGRAGRHKGVLVTHHPRSSPVHCQHVLPSVGRASVDRWVHAYAGGWRA